jgi:hypothetical protein
MGAPKTIRFAAGPPSFHCVATLPTNSCVSTVTMLHQPPAAGASPLICVHSQPGHYVCAVSRVGAGASGSHQHGGRSRQQQYSTPGCSPFGSYHSSTPRGPAAMGKSTPAFPNSSSACEQPSPSWQPARSTPAAPGRVHRGTPIRAADLTGRAAPFYVNRRNPSSSQRSMPGAVPDGLGPGPSKTAAPQHAAHEFEFDGQAGNTAGYQDEQDIAYGTCAAAAATHQSQQVSCGAPNNNVGLHSVLEVYLLCACRSCCSAPAQFCPA